MLKAGAQQGASASGGDLAIMLVVEVYNKAEWEISGESDDSEGWARKSMFFFFHLFFLCSCRKVVEGLVVKAIVANS